ncbi:hypothetical protein [Streptomyces sp. SPB162]|uniref:hypothetical protein n=1 Tax=Streptomyces sp. SPB162 TaxID=2940560 RepID=UPI0024075984|nr:hypothetical protein [Streptomyces sp. SPB162]MDF9814421.1 hypothetical protein [Streptomyces sp. SPB162]
MAGKARTRTFTVPLLVASLVLLLDGCTGGGTAPAGPSLPDPEPGKVASFALEGLSTEYDLGEAVSSGTDGSYVASDSSGNVYMMNGSDSPADVLRMTPQGQVTRFARIASLKYATGMAATPDGGLLLGITGGLIRVDRHGTPTPAQTSHHFDSPTPIGARPDGSVIVVDDGRVWSLKGGGVTLLYGKPGTSGGRGTVDSSGTVYVQPAAGDMFGDMIVLPLGKAPYRLRISGNLPGSSTPISGLVPATLTAARGGGFYAMVTNGPQSPTYAAYVIRVRGATATAVAKGSSQGTCAVGEQYPALDNRCTMPWFVTQSGNRVLVIGSNTMSGKSVPALAIRADTT